MLRFSRDSLARGVDLVLEHTEDFGGWDPVATWRNGLPPDAGRSGIAEGPGVIREVTVTHQGPPAPSFYRLRVVID